MHELGALAVGVVAALEGWRPIFLGGNLPVEEIAGAARKSKARAVALSIVYPSDDPRLAWELVRLKKALPQAVVIFAGGRGVEGYRAALEEIGAIVVSDLSGLRRQLELIRSVPAAERRSKNDK
jgi:methanogenic corrinoid protein MtbC1